MNFKGKSISSGTAYGKIGYLNKSSVSKSNEFEKCDQIQTLKNAIDFVTEDLKKEVFDKNPNLTERILEIFETHLYIINDPILIDKAKELIEKNGLSAQDAYDKAVSEVLSKFEEIDNEYMLGRIVDIIDATDHVKDVLKSIVRERVRKFDEPTILVLKDLKPSIIYNITNSDINIVGFVSEKGFYHQHSGIIARTFNVPGMICEDIFEKTKNKTYIQIDCENETIKLFGEEGLK